MLINTSQIRALLSLQYAAVRNSFRDHARRRGMFASVSISLLWYGVWFAAAGLCLVTPRMIGVAPVESALPGLLFFMLAYWQLSPLITLSLGISLDMRRLVYYPTETPTLFAVECILRLWTGVEMALVLVGLGAGLIIGGTAHPWLVAVSFTLFLAFNVLLSAGLRNLIERIFRRRFWREIILILMVTSTVVPQILLFSSGVRRFLGQAALNQSPLPHWATPAGLTAHASLGKAGVSDWILLALAVIVAGLFGYKIFRSSCRFGGEPIGADLGRAGTGPISKILAVLGRALRILPDPVGALVEKEVRYLWRSPRFRLPFFMGFTFAVIAWAPILQHTAAPVGAWLRGASLTLIVLYSFLLLGPVLFLNRFGFDRGATRFYFWMPVTFRQMLLAKNLATAFYCFVEVLLIALVCRAIGFAVSLSQLFETGAVGAVGLLWLLSIGNHMTVRFPTPSNPDRVSRGGASHGVVALVQFVIFPLCLLPAGAAYIVRFGGGTSAAFALTLAVAGVGGLGFYWLTFLRSSRYGEFHREGLVEFLSSGEGPIAAE